MRISTNNIYSAMRAFDSASQLSLEGFDEMLEFFLMPTNIPELRSNAFMFNVSGLKARLRGYQLYAVWWTVTRRTAGLNGMLLADSMGYGKTLEQIAFAIISHYFNKLTLEAWLWILDRESREGSKPHVNPRRPPANLRCPSQQEFPILCPCVYIARNWERRREPNWAQIRFGASVFLCNPDLLQNLAKEWDDKVDQAQCPLRLIQCHRSVTSRDKTAATRADKEAINTPWDFPDGYYHTDIIRALLSNKSSRYAFLSTPDSVVKYVCELYENAYFARIIIDEWHLAYRPTNQLWNKLSALETVNKAHQLPVQVDQPFTLFVSGTPMPAGPESLKKLIETVVTPEPDVYSPYKPLGEEDYPFDKLEPCTEEHLQPEFLDRVIELYRKVLKGRADNREGAKYSRRLKRIIQAISVARNQYTAWLDGEFAVESPLHKHFKITCRISEQYRNDVLQLAKKIEKRNHAARTEALDRIKKSGKSVSAVLQEEHVIT